MSIPQGPKPPSGEYPSSGYPTDGSAPGGYPPSSYPTSSAPSYPTSSAPGYPTGGSATGGYPTGGVAAAGPAPYQPAAPRGTSGVAVAGLVLSVLFFPLGFLLSLIALLLTGKGGKKGRGLAVTGLLISLVVGGGVGFVYNKYIKDNLKNISTLTDPGCDKGKDVILAGPTINDSTDPAAVKTNLQTIITGLDAAAAASKNADVKAAITALSKDYGQLVTALTKGTVPPADLITRVEADGNRIDELCTIGGAKK